MASIQREMLAMTDSPFSSGIDKENKRRVKKRRKRKTKSKNNKLKKNGIQSVVSNTENEEMLSNHYKEADMDDGGNSKNSGSKDLPKINSDKEKTCNLPGKEGIVRSNTDSALLPSRQRERTRTADFTSRPYKSGVSFCNLVIDVDVLRNRDGFKIISKTSPDAVYDYERGPFRFSFTTPNGGLHWNKSVKPELIGDSAYTRAKHDSGIMRSEDEQKINSTIVKPCVKIGTVSLQERPKSATWDEPNEIKNISAVKLRNRIVRITSAGGLKPNVNNLPGKSVQLKKENLSKNGWMVSPRLSVPHDSPKRPSILKSRSLCASLSEMSLSSSEFNQNKKKSVRFSDYLELTVF